MRAVIVGISRLDLYADNDADEALIRSWRDADIASIRTPEVAGNVVGIGLSFSRLQVVLDTREVDYDGHDS